MDESKEMVGGDEVTAADLPDWRKLGQGVHARFVAGDFPTATRFLAAVGEADPAVGDHLQVRLAGGALDLKLITLDAVYADDSDTEHQVEWITRTDLDLARLISGIAAEHGLTADPRSITAIEVGLDTASSATLAPIWSTLLTGGSEAVGRGTLGDDVRDLTARAPILWFQETDAHPTPRQRFHFDIQVPYDVAEERIAAAVAAGATVVDDSDSPGHTILADPEGNRVCVETYQPPPG